MTTEPFPPEIAEVLDRVWAQRKANAELDADGRFVRGTFAGMTHAEVRADRDEFRRLCGE